MSPHEIKNLLKILVMQNEHLNALVLILSRQHGLIDQATWKSAVEEVHAMNRELWERLEGSEEGAIEDLLRRFSGPIQ